MDTEKKFPVPGGGLIPFALVEAQRERIERAHGQTLERLAERGGLGTQELMEYGILRPPSAPPE